MKKLTISYVMLHGHFTGVHWKSRRPLGCVKQVEATNYSSLHSIQTFTLELSSNWNANRDLWLPRYCQNIILFRACCREFISLRGELQTSLRLNRNRLIYKYQIFNSVKNLIFQKCFKLFHISQIFD